MQLVLVILGAVLGLVYGQYEDGFVFNSKICLFAGLTLIMPTLFQVKFSDITLVWEHRIILIKGLILNYLTLPAIAIGIGMLTGNFGVATGLFLLSILSGGGMVMHWIKKSNADTSLGFVLLFINLVFVSVSLLMLHFFGVYMAEYYSESYSSEVNVSSFARGVINLLIVIPFIISRIIIFIKPVQDLIEKWRKYISHISIFIILFYLFGLQNSQQLFELYDFEPELIYISAFAVITFYALIYGASRLMYNLDSVQERAAFWHSVTRYITLALVISTFTTGTFGISMILPIIFAYVVQIPFAIYIDYTLSKKEFA